jgi:hypothetical protein
MTLDKILAGLHELVLRLANQRGHHDAARRLGAA